jgi:hypothetical protein
MIKIYKFFEIAREKTERIIIEIAIRNGIKG